MSIKFDKLNLTIPVMAVDCLNLEQMSLIRFNDKSVSYRFEQKVPFEYTITYTQGKENLYIEFSGKVLLDYYPDLISKDTIEECFYNLNSIENTPCIFMIKEAIQEATVNSCDVTKDVTYNNSIMDLKKSLTLTNSAKYVVAQSTINRFAITNTTVSQRKRERLIVYDKADEMKASKNKVFLDSITNNDEQLNYFEQYNLRYELNLKSVDRIRKFFKIEAPGPIYLTQLLNSMEDPILTFLLQTISESREEELLKKIGTPKDIMRFLLFAFFDYDLTKLESFFRNNLNSHASIKNVMEPFKILKNRYQKLLDMPEKKLILYDLSDSLRYSILNIFNLERQHVLPNLIDIYKAGDYSLSEEPQLF